MAKSKNPAKAPFAIPKTTAQAAISPKVESHAVRETVESIVIAFVLAFLFRTFEAEAFVIPTGSMAPTLMGRHKDVDCPKCGYRYQVTASEEEPSEERNQAPSDIISGMCPMCRYTMPMLPNLPAGVPERGQAKIAKQPSYNGDRILVNKYLYTFSEPNRWDVVVFKYPGDAKVNYIKRLIGLPGETLRIYQGDIFIGPEGATKDEDFKIERKPPDKVLAMRQLVHDTDYDPAELDAAGWPLRWHASPDDAHGWKLDKTIEGINVRQRYSVDATGNTTSWLRYEHLLPSYDDWQQVADAKGGQQAAFANMDRSQRRRLITDANPYNARVDRNRAMNGLRVAQDREGIHWVGDLMVEADVQIESASGELLLDLVEGGKHFKCTFDLKSGEAKLSAADIAGYAPMAKTSVVGPGTYHVAFANVDDQLLLWVDGRLVSFEGGTAYDATKVFGDRRSILPVTRSESDLGDLAPVGIGARDAKLVVSRMKVWRDIYYIAIRWDQHARVTDFGERYDDNLLNLASNPDLWSRFGERQSVDFPIGKEQLFVMGDNSAESSDARLWRTDTGRGHPGGAYLDKRLLIGKALSVYWPHSWNRIPGTPIPFPLFPNVGDMRLVR